MVQCGIDGVINTWHGMMWMVWYGAVWHGWCNKYVAWYDVDGMVRWGMAWCNKYVAWYDVDGMVR